MGMRTLCILAMRNVTCGCGGGVILDCYDASVAEKCALWLWLWYNTRLLV